MKWFFLISFVAGSICTVVWTGLVLFVIATARYRGMGVRGPAALALPLVFFIWASREMFRAFKGIGLNE
jgi:hypothetical protein